MTQTIDRSLTRQQWEDLQYPISLRALTEEEGGGWFVTIPLLGEATCAADGETIEEALANLEELRRSLYEVVVASKHPIPLPGTVTEKEARPSGKWAMRASSELHAKLQKGAEEVGVSFNTYCIECLSRGCDADAAQAAVRAEFAALKADLMSKIGGQVRREVRFVTQKLADELDYERARTALLEAEVKVSGPSFAFSSQQPASKPHLHLVSELQAA